MQGRQGDLVTFVRFSPDGRVLVSASQDGTARVWETATGVCLRVLRRGHEGRVNGGAFHPGGATFSTCGRDRRVARWRVTDGELVSLMRGVHEGPIKTLAWNRAGNLLATGSEDNHVILHDRGAGGDPAVLDVAGAAAISALRRHRRTDLVTTRSRRILARRDLVETRAATERILEAARLAREAAK